MRPLFVLITLMSGFPLVAASQHSFSDSSRLKDPIYVRQQIREISHADLWSALDTDIPALTGARRAVAAGDYRQAIRCWADYWASHARPGYVTTLDRLLLDTDLLADVDSFRAAMNNSTAERDTILAHGASVFDNTIQTWGDSIVHFGDSVDFNREIGRSGKYGFHYWFWCRPLLMSWLHTGDVRYALKFQELFNSWYDQRNGIASSIPDLDVVYYELGLGVRNRVFIEFYIQHFTQWALRTHECMLKTMLAAGRWLYELERWEGYRAGNWQIHGSYMLAQIALVFPEFRESPQWLSMGLRRMSEHLEQDFFADGGHSERCPRNYTLATYVSFRNLAFLLDKYHSHPDLSARIRASMGRTLEWWLTMITPQGESPAINDSHRGLFPTRILEDGGELFAMPAVSGVLRNLCHDTISASPVYPPFTSRHMPASGFTVMRSDWTPDAMYLSVNHGPAAGFHTHFDLLDFELYAFGKPLAVDAGIGLTYDDPLYESWYRASRAHNMVVVNDSNIIREDHKGENVLWESTGRFDYFSGTHTGYERFGVQHRRQIVFVKPLYWFVLDDLSCTHAGDTLSWYFHSPAPLRPSGSGFVSVAAPGIEVFPSSQQFATRTGTGMAASSSVTLPGKTERIPWIRFDQVSCKDSLHHFAVLLSPFRNPGEHRSANNISARHYRISSEGFDDDLYFSDGAYADGVVETDARFVLIRHNQLGPSMFALTGGTYLRYGHSTLWKASHTVVGEGGFQP